MKTLDGKCVCEIKGTEYVSLKDYANLLRKKDVVDQQLIFEKAYITSLKKIIYKIYRGIELSTLETYTLIQSIEENEKEEVNV